VKSLFPALYAILDFNHGLNENFSIAKSLAGAGVQLIQLRAKSAPSREFFEASRMLSAELRPGNVRFIVNDRPDIAAMVDAGGVHVGQEDLPVEQARRICGDPRWVGVSTHNLAQFRAVIGTSADYIAVGPIFPTSTKENPDPVVGLDLLRAVRPLTKKPIVAIGGITIESAEAVYSAGVDSLAVVRDLVENVNPAERARKYLAIAGRVRAGAQSA
jgi:thiamine-phosphate pyrophosphorylase